MRIPIPARYVESIESGKRMVVFEPGVAPYTLGSAVLWSSDEDGTEHEIPVVVDALSITRFGALSWREAYMSGHLTDVEALHEDLWTDNPELSSNSVLTDISFRLVNEEETP